MSSLTLPRRRWATLAVLLLAVACTPTAAPPASAPASTPAASSGPAVGATGGQGSGAAAWQSQWDQMLVAARQEGAVSLALQPGQYFRDWVGLFERTYPGIQLEISGMTGADFVTRATAERRADQYLWDVYIGGPESGHGGLKPAGALDPLPPALLLPEVLDDSKWLGGFSAGFTDVERQYVYDFVAEIIPNVYVNRDVIPESQLSRVEDLTDPRWRGRISIYDPRRSGKGASDGGHWVMVKGEDWWRELLLQEPVVTADRRQQVEWAVRGQFPIGISVSNTTVAELQKEGIGQNLKPLAIHTEMGGRISMAQVIGLLNRARHPNAARVFVNWALTRDAQALYSRLFDQNSRRLDVEGPADTRPDPNGRYAPSINQEEYLPYQKRAQDIAQATLK